MSLHKTDIVIIKKNSDFYASTFPEGGVQELYKRCGFKKSDGFQMACSWKIPSENKIVIKVYGKVKGRAGAENKAELPPPIDKTLFFGNIAVVAFQGSSQNKPISLSVERLLELLDILGGGSEDLNGANAEEKDAFEDAAQEVALRAKIKKKGVSITNDGYMKDGFVVDDQEVEMIDNENDDSDNNSEDENEEDDEDMLDNEGSEIDFNDDEKNNDTEETYFSGHTLLEYDPDLLDYEIYDSE